MRTDLALVLLLFTLALPATSALGATKAHAQPGTSLQMKMPAPLADVLEAVKDVANDQIVHGTYVYEKDKKLGGAQARSAAAAFGTWQGPGTAFYKVAEGVLDPRHFKASNGMGTVSVRYVVSPAGAAETSLRIDAVFVEDARRRADQSDGNVESAEYDAIYKQLFRARNQKTLLEAVKKMPAAATPSPLAPLPVSEPATKGGSSIDELERHVAELRHRVEAAVKEDGTALRSAPFSRASMVQMLSAKTEVLIVVLTPYWYGVETADGHHGWIRRSQLESMP